MKTWLNKIYLNLLFDHIINFISNRNILPQKPTGFVSMGMIYSIYGRSRYQGQGQVIPIHRYCGMTLLPLIPASAIQFLNWSAANSSQLAQFIFTGIIWWLWWWWWVMVVVACGVLQSWIQWWWRQYLWWQWWRWQRLNNDVMNKHFYL